MKHTINALAKMAGISTRTLRYYDEIGLLVPPRQTQNGYRVYTDKEVDRLQQILFYRALDVPLADIRQLLDTPDFCPQQALLAHREALVQRRAELDALIHTVDLTLQSKQEGWTLTDEEKLQVFRREQLAENDRLYGQEIRDAYGEEAVARSYAQFKGTSTAQFERFETLGDDILHALQTAFATGDPAGAQAQYVAQLHRKWLTMSWGMYDPEMHAALAQGYVDDPRFTAYYDRQTPGMAAFLRDTILIYTKHLADQQA